MDFVTTVSSTTLGRIDAWLATLAPDATAGITRDVGGCLVRNYLVSRGHRQCVVLKLCDVWGVRPHLEAPVLVHLPREVAELAARFDEAAGLGVGWHPVTVRVCRRLIRELQATPEALPAAEAVPA